MSKIETRVSRAVTAFKVSRGEKPRGAGASGDSKVARREWVKAMRAQGRAECVVHE